MAPFANLVIVALLGACLIEASVAGEVNYNGWTYTFSISDLYHGKQPLSPQQIAPIMRLYTVNAPSGEGQILDSNYPETIIKSDFKPNRQTKIIIHGYTENGMTERYIKMKDAYLKAVDVNVIIVDWRIGASGLYPQSRANTRVIGRETAAFLDVLSSETGADFDSFHMVGHSLGAHVAGYAGEALFIDRQVKVGRITGLDPAGPLFGGKDVKPSYRLDKTDAQFVDVIHTDGDFAVAGGMGLMDQLGNQDFYPNGGKDMPGCQKDITNILESVFCDHQLSVHYFTETIPRHGRYPTITYQQSWTDKLVNAVVFDDCTEACPEMGEHAQPGREGAFYVKTN